ncbi:MAG: metallophosphoesterase [Candidatus Curtissbacteria bacterium]|nr:metallophosphoesterase [Candidatus Curtissbacteria bacterium]
MKKLLLFFVLGVLLAFGFLYFKNTVRDIIFLQDQVKSEQTAQKRPIMRVGLIADSENDNENLKKALRQATGYGVNFVIGLGDWSNVGTEDELLAVKKIFDDSKIQYFLTPGDHDLWASRNRGEEALENFRKVFGQPSQVIDKQSFSTNKQSFSANKQSFSTNKQSFSANKQSFSANKEGIRLVILDNSDIYKGISVNDWKMLEGALGKPAKLHFVFAHKTPFHPDSKHVMGEDSPEVARQAQTFLDLLQAKKVDGFFSGDLHFFAKFKSPDASVKITTIGAIVADRNFQGSRFGVLTIFDDWTWEVEDVEIR